MKIVVLSAVLLMGCASAPAAPTTCSEFVGSYSAKYLMKSGTCGVLPDGVITIPKDQAEQQKQAAASGCSGTYDISENRCSADLSKYTCPGATAGTTVEISGKVTVASDSKSASGTVQITVRQGATQSCTGVYDLRYEKL